MTKETQFVVKTDNGTYVGLHSNGKEINLCNTSLELAPKLTLNGIKTLVTKFHQKFSRYGCSVYEVRLSEVLVDPNNMD